MKKILETDGLAEVEIPLTPLTELPRQFEGTDPVTMAQILALGSGKPMPDAPLQIGKRFVLLKWIKSTAPNLDDFEKNKEAEISKIKAQRARQLFEMWYAEQAALAKVKIN
jgi:hypothetical protein